MNWIRYPKIKPEYDCTCLVYNEKFGGHFQANYHHESDVFVLYDPTRYNSPPLHVTHYIIIPQREGK